MSRRGGTLTALRRGTEDLHIAIRILKYSNIFECLALWCADSRLASVSMELSWPDALRDALTSPSHRNALCRSASTEHQRSVEPASHRYTLSDRRHALIPWGGIVEVPLACAVLRVCLLATVSHRSRASGRSSSRLCAYEYGENHVDSQAHFAVGRDGDRRRWRPAHVAWSCRGRRMHVHAARSVLDLLFGVPAPCDGLHAH